MKTLIPAALMLFLDATPSNERLVSAIVPHMMGLADLKGDVLSAAQIKAGTPVELAFRGHDAHVHIVKLGEAELGKLRRGETLSVESGKTDGHTHTVLFDPARAPADAPTAVLEGDAPRLFVALGEVGAAPDRLAVRVAVPVDFAAPTTKVTACFGYAGQCPLGSSRWIALARLGETVEFASAADAVKVGDGQGALWIRAEKADGSVLRSILRLNPAPGTES